VRCSLIAWPNDCERCKLLFNSFTFAALLVPTLLLYWLSRSQTLRLTILFAASLIFYAWYHWPSVLLLLATISANYAFGLWLEKNKRRAALTVAVVSNLSLLIWFKYAAFLTDGRVHPWLPLGISFFTFQVIAYQVDVWRGLIRAERSPLVFAVFKGFFAQLIAGPITRASVFLPQLRVRQAFDPAKLHRGLYMFAVGLALKIGVADVLRQFADNGFAHAAELSTTDAWLDLAAFSLQLFADFWGYSTMAVGLGWMFGFALPVNFATPYLSASLQDFWRRWHITLSSWFRNYVYIPLGGNRTHALRNLLITMTVAGLWHGAGWTFVLWGFLHGLWLAAERITPAVRLPHALRVALTFIGVTLLWVLFRAPTFAIARTYYARLLLPPYRANPIVPETLSIWLVGFALLHPLLARTLSPEWVARAPLVRQVALTVALLVMCLAYGGQRYDFVYFAF
jgi:alginate O-acetyltransferase complex protein AlgI